MGGRVRDEPMQAPEVIPFAFAFVPARDSCFELQYTHRAQRRSKMFVLFWLYALVAVGVASGVYLATNRRVQVSPLVYVELGIAGATLTAVAGVIRSHVKELKIAPLVRVDARNGTIEVRKVGRDGTVESARCESSHTGVRVVPCRLARMSRWRGWAVILRIGTDNLLCACVNDRESADLYTKSMPSVLQSRITYEPHSQVSINGLRNFG